MLKFFWPKVAVLLLSLFFAYAHWIGFFGYGHDFIVGYSANNISHGYWSDFLGWRVATATINNVHVGILLTGVFLAFSASFLVFHVLEFDSGRKVGVLKLIFALVLVTAILLTWPYFMSYSNAMRQGIAASLITLGFLSLLRQYRYSYIILLSSVFFHNSAAFLVFLFFLGRIVAHYFSYTFLRLSTLFASFVLAALSYFEIFNKSKIIGIDFSNTWLAIGLMFVLSSFLKSGRSLGYVYLLPVIAGAFFINFLGMIWQIERVFMIILYPMIVTSISVLKQSQQAIVFSVIVCLLLLATHLTGMHASYK